MVNATLVGTDDPIKETWRLLRRFLDNEFTTRYLQDKLRIYEEPDKSLAQNLRKQSNQIAYCIRQAEEYFRAAQGVTLVTRPTLIYYGINSLAYALILLKGTGTNLGQSSFDYLRKKKKQRHHGLDITDDFYETLKPKASLPDFFSSMKCKLHMNSLRGEFWGTFPNFYNSLGASSFILKIKEWGNDPNIYQLRQDAIASFANPELSTLADRIFNCFDLVKLIPDFRSPSSLIEYYSFGELVPVSIEAFYFFNKQSSIRTFEANFYLGLASTLPVNNWLNAVKNFDDENAAALLNKLRTDHKEELSEADIQEVRSLLKSENRVTVESHSSSIAHVKWWNKAQSKEGYHIIVGGMPPYYTDKSIFNIVEDLQGRHYLYLSLEHHLTEPAILYILAFCLGMLSRYAPDIWVHAIDNNVPVAEFTDSLLYLLSRKFPLLILDQMTDRKHQIGMTHQA